MAKGLSAAKAKKILKDGYVKGKPLTAKQIKYFGAIANGATPLKAINGGWLDKYESGGEVPKAQIGLVNKLYKWYKGADNVVDVANTVRKTSNVVDNAWAVKPLPGLHLKSTMNNGAISKIIQPKTGFINTEQALAIINKESGGPEKVALIRQQLGDNIPKKMDYNEFRAATQKSLIPLEVKINIDGNSQYGLENIGYNPWKVEHEALTISNRNQFGTGSSMHNNPDDTLGHVHFFKDADDPNTLTITQIQSDAFQGQYNTKQTKEQLKRSLSLNEKHLEGQRKLHASAVQDPDSRTWTYPNGEVLTNNAHKKMLDGQKNWNKMQQADIDNYSQKQLLAKNHEERYLQEIVNYAGSNGNNKIRIPTMETAAKVQGFNDMQKNMGVLKKYKNQPKTIKKLYGQDVITITDSKGNTWYEFDIPESFKSGTGEIKAFKEGGWLDKFGIGGSLPGASGMMYARTSGTTPEEPNKAKSGGRCWPGYKTVSGKTPFSKGSCQKAQDGTVEYGTPEYKKAYEEGTLVKNLLTNEDVYNPLDEVVMYSGVDYEKYPYYNDLSAQQRKYFNDDGPIGRSVRRAASTKRGLAEDTYDVVNPIMYTMMGVAGGLAAGPNIATLGRVAAPYLSRYALKPIQNALRYKPLGGPVSIGNVIDGGSAAYAAYATPEAYSKFKENPSFDTGLDLGLTAMDMIPFGEIFTGGKNIKNLYNKGKNLLTNDLKPNSDMYYRGIGQAGLDDVLQSGLLRAKPSDQIAPAMFGSFDMAKRFDNLYVTPRLGVAQRYGKGVVAEVPRDVANFSKRYKKSDWSMRTNNQIPIEQVNFYKKNFFGNYKPIDIPSSSLSDMPWIQPNIYPTSSPLSKNMEPYLSRKVYPFNKEQEIFESFLSTDRQLKNIDSKSINYDADGNIIPKAQIGKILKKANDLYKIYKSTNKVVDAANTVKKTDKVVSNSLNPLEIADQIIPRFNVLGPVGGDIMQLSPLNAIPFYGKNLKGKNMAFRKFGNSIYDVIQRQALSPVGGSDFRMGKNQIVSEGNWAAMSRPSENYSGVFEATFDFNNPFANLSPTGIRQRNGVLITDKLGRRLTEIPLTEPGLSFNRRLPFSTRYVPIDKQKLIDDKFQLATFGPRLQSLAEKYGIGLLGAHLIGEEDTYNKYTIDPVIENTEKVFNDLKKMKSDDDNKDELKDGGWLSKYEKGGVIEDDRGQWAYPGEITKINSNNITMKGVNYPVLGVSDTGDKKMMQPGKDYKFDGNSVTEYPMAKDGKSLVELNQLTNFTNYNTPQPGGWLNKYN